MKKKIFVVYGTLMIIGIMLTGFLAFSLIKTNYTMKIEEQLISNGELINSFIGEKLENSSTKYLDFDSYAMEYAMKSKLRVTFIDKNGIVMGDSEVSEDLLDLMENHMYRAEVKKALKGYIGKDIRTSSTTDVEYIYVAIPLKVNNEIYGVTRVAFPFTEMRKINLTLLKYIFLSVICGIFLSLIIGYRYVDNATKPIKEITEISRKIAKENYKGKVEVSGEDEIRILAENFNIMVEKLNNTIKETRDKNIKLKSTLSSMKAGIFAVDKELNVILVNHGAKELLNIDEVNVYKRHMDEVIHNEELKVLLKELLIKGESIEKKVEVKLLEKRILKIYTNPIKLDLDPNRILGVMALIEDITEITRLENMRSQFVANVTHELKTPLTSISGFIETLKSGAIDNKNVRNRFLDIIEVETERLNRLIDDILTLSDIENRSSNTRKEEINVKSSVEEVFFLMKRIGEQKNVECDLEISSSISSIYGNRDWFKQMLINLIDNGIKYTNENGKLYIKVYEKYNKIIISIKDTGIGIPKEDIPRLFERFYRVDKARSRKVGGTGLGLAIVKHIVLSFKGVISVNSIVGEGSEFLIKLPTRKMLK
ncbi:MAG: cell wall metabolism sensor histidine kinase WalK [Anaeromicrobium sp.]|jgi:two-component system phosphate regulon sensor histidine kinase PhoR|uniref:two-component system histidine kinase PnpS n=1 Tax=Anaeromicrobium sp. TaxID=1929132 RepID=UPI0025FE76E3|nr:ATP-binding protein [Anaeromicrobium sp.]MCT4592908.1 cell wall metabolism sensor histidine kinase WalK [Anaeromicrobium sp.]